MTSDIDRLASRPHPPAFPRLEAQVHLGADGEIVFWSPRSDQEVVVGNDQLIALAAAALCDGTHHFVSIAEICGAPDRADEVAELLNALAAADLVSDSSRTSRRPHELTANVRVSTAEHGPRQAADSSSWPTKWRPSGERVPRLARLNIANDALAALVEHRVSAAWPPDLAADAPSLEATLQLIAHAYGAEQLSRPTASAGALYPLIIGLLSPLTPEKGELYIYDDNSRSVVRTQDAVELADVAACFIDPEGIFSSLANGHQLLIISADLDRVCGKYRGRGYRFAAFEAGMFAQLFTMLAQTQGCRVRLIGGFYDAELDHVLYSPTQAPILLTALVTA